jgi:hypothetical protein
LGRSGGNSGSITDQSSSEIRGFAMTPRIGAALPSAQVLKGAVGR